jgi:hypothetical protein
MKIIFICLFSIGLFISCSSKKAMVATTYSSDFTLLDSKYENSVSGYINGRNSTEYFFKIIITSNNNIQFDSAWIDDFRYSTFISRPTTVISNIPQKIKNGDTLIVRVSAFSNGEKEEPPISHKGRALLKYRINSLNKYFLIEEIELQTGSHRQ